MATAKHPNHKSIRPHRAIEVHRHRNAEKMNFFDSTGTSAAGAAGGRCRIDSATPATALGRGTPRNTQATDQGWDEGSKA